MDPDDAQRPTGPRSIEDVSEYPRPPRVEPANVAAQIWIGDMLACDAAADSVLRVLETFHPPGIYFPRAAFAPGVLRPFAQGRTSYCEFKGTATYLDLHGPDGIVLSEAGWTYPSPTPGYELLANLVAVYPGSMTRCTLDGEAVTAQPGNFYGGWITSAVTGPIKGAPGTTHW